jgi:outer membrane protein OmpA-like peptidoglycan-associated protein
MAFDLNKKGEKKKFDLSKSKDVSEVNLPKEKASPSSKPDLTKKRYIISKPEPVKKDGVHQPDLTKEKGDTPAKRSGKKKSARGIFYLSGAIILAAGIWYLIARSGPGDAPAPSSTKATTKPSAPAPLNNSSSNASTPPGKNIPANPEIKSSAPVTASSLNNKVLANFEPGSSSFISVDDITVRDIASYLSQNTGSKLTVYGFASSEGDAVFNQSLSQQRADACKRYLTGKGISSDRILSIGKGIENPVSSNSTEEGRIKNRRVEIVLN